MGVIALLVACADESGKQDQAVSEDSQPPPTKPAPAVGGRNHELRFYVQNIENFDPARISDYCPRLSWSIEDGELDDEPVAPATTEGGRLGACTIVYSRRVSGERVRIGLSASSAVMALYQARDLDWNDALWKASVISTPTHGSLVKDESLEASYFYIPEAGFTGVERVEFEVSSGAASYQVEQLIQVDPLNPDYERNVPPEYRECPPFTLPAGSQSAPTGEPEA